MTVYLAKYTPVQMPKREKIIEGEPIVREVLVPTPGNKIISLTLGGETWVRVKDPAVVKWLKEKLKRKEFGVRRLFQSEGTTYLNGRWKDIQWLLRDPPTKIGKVGVEIEVSEHCRELWEPPDARGLKGIIDMIKEAINK